MGLRLAPGEQVRVRTRAHPRALTGPVIRLMLTALAVGYLQGVLARGDLAEVLVQARPFLSGAVWVLAGLVLFVGVLRPAWRWFTRSTILTSRRILQSAGLGRSRERALHLLAVYDVRLRQRRGQRMVAAGDLIIEHGAGSQWVLAGMPEAARFHELILREMADLRREVAAQTAPAYPSHGDPGRAHPARTYPGHTYPGHTYPGHTYPGHLAGGSHRG